MDFNLIRNIPKWEFLGDVAIFCYIKDQNDKEYILKLFTPQGLNVTQIQPLKIGLEFNNVKFSRIGPKYTV